jgi:hypothetical protein
MSTIYDFGEPGPQHRKPRSRKKRVAGGCLLAGLATVLGVASCSVLAGSSDTSATDPAPTKSRSSAPVTPADPALELLTWYSDVTPEITKFQSDLSLIAVTTGLPSVSTCTELRDDVREIQKKPIPDGYTLVHNNWNRGMSAYTGAFEACIDRDFDGMVSGMTRGNESLGAATEAIPG